jgi:hypothetical protein
MSHPPARGSNRSCYRHGNRNSWTYIVLQLLWVVVLEVTPRGLHSASSTLSSELLAMAPTPMVGHSKVHDR